MINQKPAALTIDNEEAAQEFFKRMNAVALGVEAKYDALTGYSRMVTETTIQTAWQLGSLAYQKKRFNSGKPRGQCFIPSETGQSHPC